MDTALYWYIIGSNRICWHSVQLDALLLLSEWLLMLTSTWFSRHIWRPKEKYKQIQLKTRRVQQKKNIDVTNNFTCSTFKISSFINFARFPIEKHNHPTYGLSEVWFMAAQGHLDCWPLFWWVTLIAIATTWALRCGHGLMCLGRVGGQMSTWHKNTISNIDVVCWSDFIACQLFLAKWYFAILFLTTANL